MPRFTRPPEDPPRGPAAPEEPVSAAVAALLHEAGASVARQATPAELFRTWESAEPQPDHPAVILTAPKPGPLLPLREQTAPFWFVFNPNRWGVVAGKLVPILGRLHAAPGSNGVDRGGDSFEPRADMRPAFQFMAEDGRFVIPWDCDGPGTTYLRSYLIGMTRHRKTGAPIRLLHWCDRWTTAYPGSDVVDTDTDGYVAWLRGLAEGGYFPPPSKAVLDRLEGWLVQRLEWVRRKWNDERHSLVLRYAADLEAVRAERVRVVALVRGGTPAAPSSDAPPVEV